MWFKKLKDTSLTYFIVTLEIHPWCKMSVFLAPSPTLISYILNVSQRNQMQWHYSTEAKAFTGREMQP